jgi:hypothetical protein
VTRPRDGRETAGSRRAADDDVGGNVEADDGGRDAGSGEVRAIDCAGDGCAAAGGAGRSTRGSGAAGPVEAECAAATGANAGAAAREAGGVGPDDAEDRDGDDCVDDDCGDDDAAGAAGGAGRGWSPPSIIGAKADGRRVESSSAPGVEIGAGGRRAVVVAGRGADGGVCGAGAIRNSSSDRPTKPTAIAPRPYIASVANCVR